MKAKKAALTKASQPEEVDPHMARLKHPLANVVAALGMITLSTGREIGGEIKWNDPTSKSAAQRLTSVWLSGKGLA